MSAEFCDTNVLVYAHDTSAGSKRDRARQLIERLWHTGDGTLSVQVLQELYVVLTRRLPHPIPPSQARDIISALGAWRIVEPTHQDVLEAIDASQRWQVSFWDTMLLTTVIRSGAEILWSEDLNDGQAYGSVVVRNPFKS